jgi:guanylate kinase
MKAFRRKLVALAAPSGGGKTTLCRMLLERYPDTCLSISFTTRPPRGGEQDGVDYNFVSRDKFQALIGAGELVEWAEVHGNYYGTSKTFLEEQCRGGKVVLLDIDVQGVDSLKQEFGQACLSVFILPPSMEELESRLRARQTESEEKLRQRLVNAAAEIARAGDFDFQIVNRDLGESFTELSALLEREVGLAD